MLLTSVRLIIIAAIIVGSRFSRLAVDFNQNNKKYIALSILLFFGITYRSQFLAGVFIALLGNITFLNDLANLIFIGVLSFVLGGFVFGCIIALRKKTDYINGY
ncbi:MAG: hypothetical protein HYR91_13495 [Flavobacteriia bacterium]|nr:hypothetical protein [Flavobacteriia bacterium]